MKVVSGGQTGVDRAALDVALELGLPCGGWCPKGRRAEDGIIPERYPLRETPTDEYAQRTEWNVRDSDGTLVLTREAPSEGTALTINIARRLGRPLFVADPTELRSMDTALQWLSSHGIRILNVAGPRESNAPGIYAQAHAWLRRLLRPDAV